MFGMYRGVKSCISYINYMSDYFRCETGVRQGENLSLFFFALFLNDLENFLVSENINGLITITKYIEEEIEIFMKCSFYIQAILLYLLNQLEIYNSR